MRRNWLVALLACCATAAGALPPSIRTIPGAHVIRPMPDGTAHFVSNSSQMPYAPTAGSYMPECVRPYTATLSRVELASGKMLWTTCLPFTLNEIVLDVDTTSGAAVVAGIAAHHFRVSGTGMGQLPPPSPSSGAGGIGVLRVRSDGAVAEWASVINGPRSFFAEPRGVRILSDGSVFIAASTSASGLPVTENAIDWTASTNGSGYMARLSADGSKLLFGSYLRRVTGFEQLDAFADGTLAMSGGTTEPATLLLTGENIGASERQPRYFVGRFDLAALRFRYFTPTDIPALYRPRMSPLPSGKLAMLFSAFRSPTTSLVQVSEQGDKAEWKHDIFVSVHELACLHLVMSGDNALIGLTAGELPPPSTASSTRRPVQRWQSAVLGMDVKSGRVLFSHVLPTGHNITGLAVTDGAILVGAAVPGAGPLAPVLPAAEPIAAETGAAVLFAAHPNLGEGCGPRQPRTPLFWDVRGDDSAEAIQVRRGSPDGEIVASGATGVVWADFGTRYYLVADPWGGPFARPPVLATETTRLSVPARCAGDRDNASVSVFPNPILSCAATPHVRTVTTVWTDGPGPVEVHVGIPTGPVFAFGPYGRVSAQTGDWVRNGMEFFLTSATEPKAVLASNRAYVLPIRDCANLSATPPPPIRATRDCTKPDVFTLAYHTGEESPVEIRTDSPEGSTVARLVGPSGLLDVSTQRATTYHLMSFDKGAWRAVASTVTDPRRLCEQGYFK